MYHCTRLLLLCTASTMTAAAAAGPANDGPISSASFFQPAPTVGSKFATVFSITKSRQVEGFDEAVKRMSGTGNYTVRRRNGAGLELDAVERYDGSPVEPTIFSIAEGGDRYCSRSGCRSNFDASGPVYNRAIWGLPPSKIAVGTKWEAAIAAPWEMGPTGRQRITVVRLDPSNHVVTLLREGSGIGPAAGEPGPVELKNVGRSYEAALVPGETRWRGYTTFRNGFVESDELIADRTSTLTIPGQPPKTSSERSYMLLNAAPPVI